MRQIIHTILTIIAVAGLATVSFAQNNNDRLVQVTGVVRMQDTSDVIPYMGIYVKNSNSGTLSSENGLFSLLAYKGDTLVFSRVGFKSRELVIPSNWDKNFYTTTQYFIQDTFVLNDFVVRPYMTSDEFDYAMRYKEYDPDLNAAIKENTSRDVITMMLRNMPSGSGDGAAFLQRQQSYQNSYYGQQAPIGLFNPFKWADFYKSVQRGDYRKKKN